MSHDEGKQVSTGGTVHNFRITEKNIACALYQLKTATLFAPAQCASWAASLLPTEISYLLPLGTSGND